MVAAATVGETVQEVEHCSFCAKSRFLVEKLIAGPGVYICNECVGLCGLILQDTSSPTPAWDTLWANQDDQALLRSISGVAAASDQLNQFATRIVRLLRERGVTWTRIGETLGITRQSAWERFSGEE
jgi:hypothetical protein